VLFKVPHHLLGQRFDFLGAFLFDLDVLLVALKLLLKPRAFGLSFLKFVV
jgi:hypothetical protein